MILKAFAIYDEKSESYSPPFFQQATGLATRMFQDLANDNQSRISKHPTDFTLYQIGTFDDHSAVLTSDQPVFLGKASEFIESHIPLKAVPGGTSGKAQN